MGIATSLPKKFLEKSRTGNSLWPERVFLCLAVLTSYASLWPNEFVYDDNLLIVMNSFLKHWSSLPQLLTSRGYAGYGIPGGFYRPVQMGLYFLIYQAFGPSAIAFHALNVALQALNACLLHTFGIRAGFKKGAAFVAALVWAVHPLHTDIVAYAASTAELLWGSFCLVGLITLLPDFTPRKIWQAMLFFILALGCKESAIVFPALAATTFFFVSKDRAQFSGYLKMWPLWLLAACHIDTWIWFIHQTGYTMDKTGDPLFFQAYTSNLPNRILTSLATLPVYLRLMIWPAGLHIERAFPIFSTLLWQPAAGVVMAGLGLLQILWGQARRGLALSFGLLWFVIALSPYTGIVIPIDAMLSDGWMYIPTMGLFLGVAQTTAGFFEEKKNAARVLVFILALSLGMTTFVQNETWRNPETVYQNIVKNGGRVNRLSSTLGMFYMRQGEFDKAIKLFQDALDHPDGRPKALQAFTHLGLAMAWLHIPPGEKDAFKVDARVLPACKHIPEAIAELEKVLQANPNFYWADQTLTTLYRYQGNNRMADLHQKKIDDLLQKK